MATTIDPNIAKMPYPELVERKNAITARLEEISVPPPPKKRKATGIPYEPKSDTHYDYLLKEMQWLAADFQAERKRHLSSRRKIANSIQIYAQGREARRLRELADAEVKRRKLAARIGRDVKSWWSKIERVVTYKQKLSCEKDRRTAMNQQLVGLVKLTEKYTDSLAFNNYNSSSDEEDDEDEGYHKRSIEEALAVEPRRKRVADYARLSVDQEELYGESTDADTDSSYEPEIDHDDETTLLEAEEQDLELQRKGEFEPAVELRKLQEESTLDIETVLERLHSESGGGGEEEEESPKRVKFDSRVQVMPEDELDPGEDADDDDTDSDSEDFVGQDEPDDETTIAQEEALPQEMSAQEELSLLQAENEISVEELRARYAAALEGGGSDDDGGEDDGEDDEVPEDYFDDGEDSDQDEFVAEEEPDDETTIAQELALPQEMSAKDEIDLLQQENEMSVEDLRKLYNMPGPDDVESVDSDVESAEEDREPSLLASLMSGAPNDDGDVDEYVPENEVDDETTIEAEEKLGRDMSYEEEIEMLKRESEMSVEELRALYAESDDDDMKPSALAQLDQHMEDDENDDEFCPDTEEKDDETTIEAEERMGREMSPEAELALLQKDSEEPIEDLLERYKSISAGTKRKRDEEESEGDEDDVESGDDSDAGHAALEALEASAEIARRTKASRPFLLAPWVKLREYQQIGLNWLVSLQSRRLNGILADEMGLGKTLQTISLLAYLAAYKGIWGPHLIVVPTSVILNWETEFKRFCPGFKILCYYGTAKRRKELRTGWTKTNWYHVVITSYQLAVQDAFAFKRKKFYYFVLDEAQNIKNFQSQRWQTLINFNTQRRLLLTGTPLQNNLMELWSLLHFLMPYIFSSRKQFSYWFANPMNNIIEGNSDENNDVIMRLHGIIRPFVLRRLKKDVESQMPGKFEHIVKCQLSRRQMFIYEEFLARSSTRQALKKGGNFMGMMNVLMQLRKVCNHPDLFEPRSVVTPFVVEAVSARFPSCVIQCCSQPQTEIISESLRIPIWSGSNGQVSMKAALSHDTIQSDELLQLETKIESSNSQTIRGLRASAEKALKTCPPALAELLSRLDEGRQRESDDKVRFLRALNSRRCRSRPFVFPARLMDAVRVNLEPSFVDDLSTPASLLAMRRDQQERASLLDDLIKKFVFCVPKAAAPRPELHTNTNLSKDLEASSLEDELLEPLQSLHRPFREAHARLSSFFPDKKLIQFDAGKLQTLAELLRELKRGGHRVLIFTQMSKMLDILEAFLNLNGHTYLRLDGSTGVDRRQRLMDRFNGDTKIFCFILSTRSGGLGINLTGADTVIFYDQDWNPAMDAQAQDRAHRIGQTREVHIYRLVTQHTVEENILLKAQQKRNLDILVMDRGKFDASQLFGHGENARAQSDSDEVKDVYTKGGLRAILGVSDVQNEDEMEIDEKEEEGLDSEKMEQAMTTLEDVDDVQALRGAQKEAADELKEFDETVEINKGSESDDEEDEGGKGEATKSDTGLNEESKPKSTEETNTEKTEEDLEKEFAAWQDEVGMDAAKMEASLAPTERYGLRFREEIDPYYSIFAVMEYRRKLEAEEEAEYEIDIDAIERQKASEERQAIDDGDLLATRPDVEDLIRQRDLYRREKSRLRANQKRRKLTGQDWEVRTDGVTKYPFWYNIDTGEATWDKPVVLHELEAHALASEKRYAAMPAKSLHRIMEYLSPLPDRMNCGRVCKHWRSAATDVSFVLHVYPVEMGAYTREDSKMELNHFRTISEALAAAQPGDTIELGDGHYWMNEDMTVEFPIRLIGDEHNPSNVVIEMGGTLRWLASGGWCEGVTFRRPKISTGEQQKTKLLEVGSKGKIDLLHTVFDNGGSMASCIAAFGPGRKGKWERVTAKGGDGGIQLESGASLDLIKSHVINTGAFGVCSKSSEMKMVDCRVQQTDGFAIEVKEASRAKLVRCRIRNCGGILIKQVGCTVNCTNNAAFESGDQLVPGFRQVENGN